MTEQQFAHIMAALNRIAEDVHETRHVLVGLSQSIGIADTALAAAAESKKVERETRERAEQDVARQREAEERAQAADDPDDVEERDPTAYLYQNDDY